MKSRFIAVALLVTVVGLGVVWYVVNEPSGISVRDRIALKKSAKGSTDDPNARVNWEIMRLKSPRTGKIPENIRARELAFAAKLPIKEDVVRSALAKGQNTFLATWTGRGPYNVGGRTRALAIDVSNESTLLAGGASGGMWRSTDGGLNWNRTTALNDDVQSVTCLVQDTRGGKTGIWYYGTGEYQGNSASAPGGFYSGDGIYKSTDGGVNWSVLSITSTGVPESFENFFDYVWNVAVDPSNAGADEVYAATYGAIWRSTNGGTSWSAVLGGSFPFCEYTDVAVTSTGVVYATMSSSGTAKGVWRSPDGITWTNITPAGFPTNYDRVVLGIAPSSENDVYFLGETPGSGAQNTKGDVDPSNDEWISFWKYTYVTGTGVPPSNGTWVDRSANVPLLGGPVGSFDTQGSYNLIVRVKPDDANFVLIGGTNLYRSTDGFASTGNTSWIGGYATVNDISQYANHHPDQHSLAFLPSNSSIVLSGHDGGISKTTNIAAGTVGWTFLNNGYYTTQFYAVAIDHGTSGNNVLIGGMQDNGSWWTNSTNATTNWLDQFSGDGAFCAIADGRTFYYFSSQNGNVYRFTLNASGVLTAFTRVTPTGASDFQFINPFVLDPNNSNMMYMAGGTRIWRNSDLSGIPSGSNNTTTVNWTDMSNTDGDPVTAIGISKTPANRLYYGTYAAGPTLMRVDDAHTGNPVPTDITDAAFPGYINCIAVNPVNADEVIVVFSNYEVQSLFRTTNGGTSWSNISGNLEDPPGDGSGSGPSCRWAAIVPTTAGAEYFVGTSTGLYSTSDVSVASPTWAQEGAGTIGNVVVNAIDVRTSDGLVVAATHGHGVFSTNIVVSVSDRPAEMPSTFSLQQNFPNPFNPSTTIRYSLPRESRVTITVYDVAGRELSRILERTQGAGEHSVTWNATDSKGAAVPSGVYFYAMRSMTTDGKEEFSRTQKMTYVK